MDCTFELKSGVKMPKFGLGTYKMTSGDALVISEAYELGYRLFDTATIYRNEQAVGKALSNHPRNSYFLTSKLGISTFIYFLATIDQGYDSTIKAVKESLSKLQSEFIDLYLIHWPGVSNIAPQDPLNISLRHDSWRALEWCLENDLVKAIGVSNFEIRHLKAMKENKELKIDPMVNQFELHPAYRQEDLIKYCQDENIIVQSYSPFGKGKLLIQNPDSNDNIIDMKKFNHPNKTTAQILLRWGWQKGHGLIPKSSNVERLKENMNIFDFELTGIEMEYLNSLSKLKMKTCWDPSSVV